MKDFSTFKFDTIFLSDLHLGSGKTAAPYLYEFLKHLDFSTLKTIYLVGDIIGGWELQNRKQQPFTEMERRVFDVINYAADQGIAVYMMPGNHDEKLRPMIDTLQARTSFLTFSKNIHFVQDAVYETAEPDKKRLKVIHGDQYDPNLFIKPWFRPITFLVSAGYDALVHIDYHLSKIMYNFFGKHRASFAKTIKSAFKRTIGFFFAHKSMMKGIDTPGIDGILMGHTHMASLQTFEGKKKISYLINDGDWVESSTAAIVEKPGQLPQILDYKLFREQCGFGDLPSEEDGHPAPFAAQREKTNRQIRMVQRLWPSRDREECLMQYQAAVEKVTEYHQEIQTLQTIMRGLDHDRRLSGHNRDRIAAVVHDTKHRSYKTQKNGLKNIFNKYSTPQTLDEKDTLFVKTVLRELSLRAERKIKKHEELRNKAAIKLDYKPAT